MTTEQTLNESLWGVVGILSWRTVMSAQDGQGEIAGWMPVFYKREDALRIAMGNPERVLELEQPQGDDNADTNPTNH